METSLERRPAGWPSDKPVWTLGVFFLAVLIVPARIAVEYAQRWNDLGAHYLPHYLLSSAGQSGRYWILNTVTRRGAHLTTSAEVEAVPVAGSPYSVWAMPFRLTPRAVERGARTLEWRRIEADNRKLHAFLRTRVYGARPLQELAKEGAIWAGAFLAIGLLIAVPRDRKAQRMYREGRIVRGPAIVTRDVFNRKRQRKGRTRGVGFVTTDRQSLREWLLIKWAYGPIVRIPVEDEPRHMLLEGNTGSGKSAAIRRRRFTVPAIRKAAISSFGKTWFRTERNPLRKNSPRRVMKSHAEFRMMPNEVGG
jgi:hypothetical protein